MKYRVKSHNSAVAIEFDELNVAVACAVKLCSEQYPVRVSCGTQAWWITYVNTEDKTELTEGQRALQESAAYVQSELAAIRGFMTP